MIANGSYLTVSDNSGANTVQCIHVLNNSNRRYASTGDMVLVTANNLNHANNISNNNIYRAIILSTTNELRRPNGQTLRFSQNSVLLLNEQDRFMGTRIYGPICREISGGNNEIQYNQIISYSRATI